jgi:hypothetical protein
MFTILLPDNFQQYFSNMVLYLRKVYYNQSIQELEVVIASVAAPTYISAVPSWIQKLYRRNCLHLRDIHIKFRKKLVILSRFPAAGSS